MRVRAMLGVFVFVGATVVITAQVLSGDEQKAGQSGDKMSQAWMKYAGPSEFHANLKPLAGRWTQAVKWWKCADMPPEASTGTCEYRWILGGRFLLQEVKEDAKSDMDHPPFEGLGMIGYDNFKKKYTSMWVDNMGTAIMTSLGTCDGSGKVFTMTGRTDDVFTGKANQAFRGITTIVNNDKHIDEMYMTGPDGKEYKALEITYSRK